MFFLRVKAVYFDSKATVVFFGILWLSIFGTLFLDLFNVTTAHIGTTKKCIITSVGYPGAIPVFLQSAFDTLVFVAISLRVASYSMAFGTRTKSFFRGHGLLGISRCILKGGQLYYLFVYHSFYN